MRVRRAYTEPRLNVEIECIIFTFSCLLLSHATLSWFLSLNIELDAFHSDWYSFTQTQSSSFVCVWRVFEQKSKWHLMSARPESGSIFMEILTGSKISLSRNFCNCQKEEEKKSFHLKTTSNRWMKTKTINQVMDNKHSSSSFKR